MNFEFKFFVSIILRRFISTNPARKRPTPFGVGLFLRNGYLEDGSIVGILCQMDLPMLYPNGYSNFI